MNRGAHGGCSVLKSCFFCFCPCQTSRNIVTVAVELRLSVIVPPPFKDFLLPLFFPPTYISRCSILVSRRSGQSLTRTVRGAAAPSPTQPPLSCWSKVKAWMPPVCTGSSLILAHSATARLKSSTIQTSTHMAKVRVVSGVAVRRGDIFLEHLHPAGMCCGAPPGPSYH